MGKYLSKKQSLVEAEAPINLACPLLSGFNEYCFKKQNHCVKIRKLAI